MILGYLRLDVIGGELLILLLNKLLVFFVLITIEYSGIKISIFMCFKFGFKFRV